MDKCEGCYQPYIEGGDICDQCANQAPSCNSKLLYGGCDDVPKNIATCPECGAMLHVMADEWIEDSGRPTNGGLDILCPNDPKIQHLHFQRDWQPVIDVVEKWAGCESI